MNSEMVASPINGNADVIPLRKSSIKREAGIFEQSLISYPAQILAILDKKGTGNIDDIEVAQIIDYLATLEQINWGEIEDIKGLYSVADKASHFLGGVPDCILKLAIKNALMLQIKGLENGWLRNHLDHLHNLWKMEMNNERPVDRSTKAVLSSNEIAVFKTEYRKRPKQKKFSKLQMGISAMLAHARNTLCLAGIKHEVSEDKEGTVEIDGEPLTFESWSRMTQNEADDVIAVKNKDQFENKINPTPSVSLESYTEPKPELEEGEISDDDFVPAKRVKHSFESETESEDECASARPKPNYRSARAYEREEQRVTAAVNVELMKQRFHAIYNMRYDAVGYMNIQQRVQMLHSLRMARSGNYDEIMTDSIKVASLLSEK